MPLICVTIIRTGIVKVIDIIKCEIPDTTFSNWFQFFVSS